MKGQVMQEKEVLNAQDLSSKLTKAAENLKHIKNILVHESLSSTNDEAWKLESQGQKSGTMVIALHQYQGRGREKRPWLNARGDVACSLLLSSAHLPKKNLSWLSLVIGLAVHDALFKLGIEVKLKWPNDIVYEDSNSPNNLGYFFNFVKLGGILVEISLREGEPTAVIGIGLNVLARPELKSSVPHVGFLRSLKPDIDAADIFLSLISELDKKIESLAGQFIDETRLRYTKICATLGRHVQVAMGDIKIRGEALFINESGALVIYDGKKEHAVYSGEPVSQVESSC